MENPPTMSQFADKVSCLEARDKYWQKEIAKLREQLDHVNHLLACESIKAERAENRAEAAEAKLKELSEQEPFSGGFQEAQKRGAVAWVKYKDGMLVNYSLYNAVKLPDREAGYYLVPLSYTSPIPPVDVQELQKQNNIVFASLSNAERKISELKRKLAEQQALLDADEKYRCHDCQDTGLLENAVEGKYPCTCITETDYWEWNDNLLAKSREEGRKEAVPEIANIREVDLRGDFAVQLVFSSCRAASAFADAMLAAAPTPGEKE